MRGNLFLKSPRANNLTHKNFIMPVSPPLFFFCFIHYNWGRMLVKNKQFIHLF